MIEFLLVIVLFMCGFGVGYIWRETRNTPPEMISGQKQAPGCYADPLTVHWFRLRAMETDPYWARMPLREYAKHRRMVDQGDTQ